MGCKKNMNKTWREWLKLVMRLIERRSFPDILAKGNPTRSVREQARFLQETRFSKMTGKDFLRGTGWFALSVAGLVVYKTGRNILPVATVGTVGTFAVGLKLFPPRKNIGLINRSARKFVRGALSLAIGVSAEVGAMMAGYDRDTSPSQAISQPARPVCLTPAVKTPVKDASAAPSGTC